MTPERRVDGPGTSSRSGLVKRQAGLTVRKDRVRGLRPAGLPPDPESRTAYEPGEVAQCDFWFPPVTVPLGFG